MPTYFAERGAVDGYYFAGQPINTRAVTLAQEAGISYQGNERLISTWLLPHANPEHRRIPEVHVFEDIMQLVDARAQGRDPVVPISQAAHVVEIMEAMYTSAREGVRVRLSSSA
jgi:predicted dehydrogenase